MSESQTWQRLKPLLKSLDPIRLEDRISLGVPDVNIVEGWIELKHIKQWPRREDIIVRIDHFTPEQRTWLTRRCRAHGRAWLLLHVGKSDDWLLFKGDVAAMVIGKTVAEQLKHSYAIYWHQGTPQAHQLLDVLGYRE